ncbi:MAG TPA: aldo/keto reductase, partial [Verrucomicrobiae bacterium]|nr:aldo/keto reductase [Verrucomicrobiae bacterium]
ARLGSSDLVPYAARIAPLGQTHLDVFPICLGGNVFGWTLDEAGSFAVLDAYAAAGGNFIDTADAYSGTISEEICGKAMAGRRTQVVLATKATMPVGSGPNDRGSSRKHLREACDASLRRLRTDYLDLYQIHAEDLWTPLEETLAALDDLVRAGKVLYVGASNFRAYRLMKALALSDRHGWARFVSLQPQYNLLIRTIEREHFALAAEEGVGLITWSPLAAGMLTGKITRERKPPESRLAQRDMPLYRFYFNERAFGIVDVLVAAAREVGCTPAQLALAWQLEKPEITSVIIGVRNRSQLEDNLGATAIRVPPEVMTRLEQATGVEPEYPGIFIDFIQTWLGNR